MTISRRARFLAVIGAAALVPAALAGCSAGGQSVADACQVAGETVTEAMGDISTATTDPAEAASVLDDAMSAMQEAGDKLENEEVKGAFTDFNDAFAGFQEIMASASDDPTSIDTEALTEVSTEVQDSATKLQELCG